jgi:hypothetical protein
VTGAPVTSTNGNAGTVFGPATAQCTGNKVLVGGGADLSGNGASGYAIVTSSIPSATTVNGTWSASATWAVKNNQTLTLTAYALCAG